MDPFRVLGHHQAASTLGKNALRLLGLEIGVGACALGEEVLLVTQALAGRAVEDPVLLPLLRCWSPSSRRIAPAAMPTSKARVSCSTPGMKPYSAKIGREIASTMIAIFENL
jgi:hypothetical protein